MTYTSSASRIADVLAHRANTAIAVFPAKRDLRSRLLSRAMRMCMNTEERSLRRLGISVIVSERTIENALVLRSLRDVDATLLDFGGFESLLPLQLAALGLNVTVLDQRRYPFGHPNLTVRCGDLLDPGLSFGTGFDTVISISTIEHLGLGAYGEAQKGRDADARGVQVLWEWVRHGGRLLASVPIGKRAVFDDFRVYDDQDLARVFPYATRIRRFMKEGREGTWREVEKRHTQDIVYSDPKAHFPVEAVAFVLCDKAR